MRRNLVAIPVWALFLTTALPGTPQRGRIVSVHHPAATVRMLGEEHLVHELWISNDFPFSTTIESVSVLDGSDTLAVFDGEELERRVGRPDLPRNHPTPLLLEADRRAVVHFWIPLSRTRTRPVRIHHRTTLTPVDASPPHRQVHAVGGESEVSAPTDVEVINAPLRGDRWAAVYDPLMIGGHRTAVYNTDGKDRIPGRFAIDFIRLLPSGRVHMDAQSRPEDWNGFGAEVLAVKTARVVAAVDGRLDADRTGKARETITRENAAGNYITLDLGNGRFAFYEHLQQGSVRVKAGDQVVSGQVIARVGSSGSVSSGPHLHFHVSDGNSLLGAEGVPFVFREFRLDASFKSITSFANGESPLPNAPGVSPTRTRERPAPNSVVAFQER